MPIYEFICGECGYLHELIMKMSAVHPRTCPHCNKESLRKKMSQTSFVLKGEGWYVTDFREKARKKESSSAIEDSKVEKKEESSSEEKKDSSVKDLSSEKQKVSSAKSSSSPKETKQQKKESSSLKS